jgi:hypothetical protein
LSKSLGKKAVEVSTYDKEVMTIIEAIKKWKHYLVEAELIIQTNNTKLEIYGRAKTCSRHTTQTVDQAHGV